MTRWTFGKSAAARAWRGVIAAGVGAGIAGAAACGGGAASGAGPASAGAAGPAAPVAAAPAAPAESPAARLYRYLIGEYDSSYQAAQDPDFRTIHLAICPADAPELGPLVLYVEQAAAEARDKPYRQRLYVIEDAAGGAAASRVFELRAPAAAIGACGRPARPRFAAADAEERAGCTVTMAWQADRNTFSGSTRDRECASSLRGAAYATSEVQLGASLLTSWDRGYNAAGAQVWGSEKGAYVFARQSAPPEAGPPNR